MRALKSPDPLTLETILEDDVEVVEVLDAVPPAVQAFAHSLVENRRLGNPFQAWCELGDRLADGDSDSATDLEALSDTPGYEDFANWARPLMEGFALLNGVEAVGIRISHLRAPMCPRFHVDVVPTRLIATLTGHGTEWLPADVVRYAADGRLAQDPAPEDVQQLAPGSIGLFKGAGFDEGRCAGVAHRSPHGEGERVVMTLDAIL